MAVVGNTSSEIGDVIVSRSSVLTGIVSISNFSDTIVGETATRFFTKSFRYSLDGGLNFNVEGYISLVPSNLVNIATDPSYDIVFEYRYERSGTDNSGTISVTNISLITTTQPYVGGPVFNSSVFSFFANSWNDVGIVGWKNNVLEKLYNPGILPVYMTRNQNQNVNQEDRDFIDFWRTVSHYFSLLVYYSREFETYRDNIQLLIEYLTQRGMYVCENMTLLDLQYIQENFWDEMRHRGTVLVSKSKGYIVNGGAPKPVDGELLRTLCYNSNCDEFLFGISENNSIGWMIDEWSPLWQGLTHQLQFNKIYEESVEVNDLSRYPRINPANISIVNDPLIGDVMLISGVAANSSSGIGIVANAYDEDFATNVDTGLTYELSFMIRVSDTGNGAPRLTVRINAYSENGAVTQLSETTGPGFNPGNMSLNRVTLNDDGIYYKVSVLIHPITSVYLSDNEYSRTSILEGNNFIFNSPNSCKVIPSVILDNTSESTISGEMRIYGFEFRPAFTEYSTGFINTANLLQTWMKNNQRAFTETQVENIMETYLLPYQVTQKNNFL